MAFTFAFPWHGLFRERDRQSRRSCRLQVEPLEDRLTPASIDFVPVAHVIPEFTIKKMPLPPTAVVEFDPFVSIGSATSGAGAITEQIHLAGVFSKQITIPPTMAGTPGQTLSLEAFYNLTGNATGNVVLPTALGDGSVRFTYSLAGTLAEILVPVGLSNLPAWLFKGSVREHGSLNGVISPPSSSNPQETLTFQFQDMSEEPLTITALPQGGSIGNSPGGNTWQEQILLNGQGNVTETLPPGGGSMTASFWQQDQVMETLVPATPTAVPTGLIQINAVFKTAGSDSITATPGLPLFNFSGSSFQAEVDTGATQYTDSLMETILMPDGSMQTVMQTSQDTGTFFELKDWN